MHCIFFCFLLLYLVSYIQQSSHIIIDDCVLQTISIYMQTFIFIFNNVLKLFHFLNFPFILGCASYNTYNDDEHQYTVYKIPIKTLFLSSYFLHNFIPIKYILIYILLKQFLSSSHPNTLHPSWYSYKVHIYAKTKHILKMKKVTFWTKIKNISNSFFFLILILFLLSTYLQDFWIK